MRPAVFLLLLILTACEERTTRDFNMAWATYHPIHVAGSDNPVTGR
jgi:hypothetical protein